MDKAFSFFKGLFQRIGRSIPQPSFVEGHLNNLQKAAVFFLSLSPEASSRLINTLSSHEIRNIASEMRQLNYVTPLAQHEVLQEFCTLLVDDGKLTSGPLPMREAVCDLADKDPKGIMSILRRHWLLPSLPYSHAKEITARSGPGERGAIFLFHLPATLTRKFLPQLSPEELQTLGQGVLRISVLSEESKHHVWNELSRKLKGNLDDHESILKVLRQLLHEDDGSVETPVTLDYPEKVGTLLKFLKPRTCQEIGQRLLGMVSRPEQESLILALRQTPDCSEKEKGGILQEFFGFLKSSLVSPGSLEEAELMEEIERLSLHLPQQVARCLETHWLLPKSLLSDWREMAEKNPNFVAQKLATFMQQEVSKEESLNNFQKAALFLRLIHPEIRVEVMKHMNANQNQFLIPEINRQWRVTIDEKRRILEEFLGQYYFLSTSKLLERTSSGN